MHISRLLLMLNGIKKAEFRELEGTIKFLFGKNAEYTFYDRYSYITFKSIPGTKINVNFGGLKEYDDGATLKPDLELICDGTEQTIKFNCYCEGIKEISLFGSGVELMESIYFESDDCNIFDLQIKEDKWINTKKLKSIHLDEGVYSRKFEPHWSCIPNLVSLDLYQTNLSSLILEDENGFRPEHLQLLYISRTYLRNLKICNLNEIKNLEISEIYDLQNENITANSNDLTISGCNNLETITIDSCECLSSMTITNNSSLKTIYNAYPYYMKDMNITENPILNRVEVRSVGTKIPNEKTTIEWGNCPSLSSINFNNMKSYYDSFPTPEQAPKLKDIKLYGTSDPREFNTEDIDISNYNNLSSFYMNWGCGMNNFTCINNMAIRSIQFEYMMMANNLNVQNNLNLNTINVSCNDAKRIGFKSARVTNNTNLTQLRFTRVSLENGLNMKYNPNLSNIEISESRLKGKLEFKDMISVDRSIYISIYSNPLITEISVHDIDYVYQMNFNSCSNLKKLQINNINRLNRLYLDYPKNLTYVDMSNNNFEIYPYQSAVDYIYRNGANNGILDMTGSRYSLSQQYRNYLREKNWTLLE